MHVGVGSQNPVKIAATEAAFERLAEEAQVTAVDVDSGVSDQPTGDGETVEGARNRAGAALGDSDLGVGIEGGVAEESGDLFLVMWAAATDGTATEIGSGPRLRLPNRIAGEVRAGRELGPVMDDVLDESGVARDRGAAGVLTAGMIDRQSALRHAVAGALAPFVTDEYEVDGR